MAELEKSKSKTLRRITLGTSAIVMTVGLSTSFDLEAQVSGSGASNKKIVEEMCYAYNSGGEYVQVGWGNSCTSGNDYCIANYCTTT